MLWDLWLPIILSAVALFIASFLSWVIIPLHRKDWIKLEKEEDFLNAARELTIPRGSYMFPGYESSAEMMSEEYAAKWEAGPVGVMTVFPKVSMAKNLGLTFLYFLIAVFCLGYLATLALEPGDSFMSVFRFVTTAALMTFLTAIMQHAIWFHNRIVGHLIESVVYALIAGTIFAALWPAA